ncbi:hypothetical protein R1A27_31390 (plasmid) [Methylobacterium sp. NMS12]|uniref:hypothetical protein n=1 Tax=Methylobacterium sp. NMS12 TaxID=3079766 RepID=UPI003F882994
MGSPEQIVDGFLKLKAAGLSGVQLTFYDFAPDLEYFGRKVLPLMREAGLRLPVEESVAPDAAAGARPVDRWGAA